mmetsp:Transcript_43411/g.140146  ORF Transcript_43411/g.140146 Transcript_43411/m.140146 type:complete len:598 (+) Transcript_43411:737-2530(+)
MVAQLGHVLVCDVVVRHQRDHVPLGGALPGAHHLLRLAQLGVQRDRRVVRAEDLCGQPLHEVLEVVVELGGVDLVEDLVAGLLLLDEGLQRLVRLGDDVGRRVVLDRVLAEELEAQLVVALVEEDVLHAQRGAADRVRLLVRVLLVAHAESEPVDQVDRHGLLLRLHVRVLHALHVVGADAADVLLELARLFVLCEVRHPLPRRVCGEHHVLDVAVDRVHPLCEPRDGVVVHDVAPAVPLPVAEVGHRRHRRALANVDGDVLGPDASLELAHLRVLAAAAEEAGGLDAEVAHLLLAAVDEREDAVGLRLVLLLLRLRLLLLGHLLLPRLLLLEVRRNRRKVALVELLDGLALVRLLEERPPRLHEVLLEGLLLRVVRLPHRREHRRHLLLLGRQRHRGAVVVKRLAVRRVQRREHDAAVLQRLPLDAPPLPLRPVHLLVPPVPVRRARVVAAAAALCRRLRGRLLLLLGGLLVVVGVGVGVVVRRRLGVLWLLLLLRLGRRGRLCRLGRLGRGRRLGCGRLWRCDAVAVGLGLGRGRRRLWLGGDHVLHRLTLRQRHVVILVRRVILSSSGGWQRCSSRLRRCGRLRLGFRRRGRRL